MQQITVILDLFTYRMFLTSFFRFSHPRMLTKTSHVKWREALIFIATRFETKMVGTNGTVDGRNPAPPGMYGSNMFFPNKRYRILVLQVRVVHSIGRQVVMCILYYVLRPANWMSICYGPPVSRSIQQLHGSKPPLIWKPQILKFTEDSF